MSNPPIKPVQSLVPGPKEYFQLADRAVQQAQAAPADLYLTLSAFLWLFQLKDWVPGGDSLYRLHCPYARTIAEIANGTKHMELTSPHMTGDPHVKGAAVMSDGGGSMPGASVVGGGPVGASPQLVLYVRTRRESTDPETYHQVSIILGSALHWWRGQISALS